jgi:predicted lipoprotein
MQRYIPWLIGFVLLAAFLIALPFSVTIVPIEQVEAMQQSEEFDAVAYVDGIWASQIVPAVLENAVDLQTILSAIEVDAEGGAPKEQLIEVANEYGSITVGEAHVYLVKDRGTVTAIDTESRAGTMTLALDDYAGPVIVKLYLGPRIPSDATAVRDAVGFIEFGDFREQTEYGKVAKEINTRVATDVLELLDKENLVGKQLEFYGATSIRTFNLVKVDLSEITVVPVQISVVE